VLAILSIFLSIFAELKSGTCRQLRARTGLRWQGAERRGRCTQTPLGRRPDRYSYWRVARRTSSTVPRPAFVSARVRGASAVVVAGSVPTPAA
jgi:hypothetical protein